MRPSPFLLKSGCRLRDELFCLFVTKGGGRIGTHGVAGGKVTGGKGDKCEKCRDENES